MRILSPSYFYTLVPSLEVTRITLIALGTLSSKNVWSVDYLTGLQVLAWFSFVFAGGAVASQEV